MGSEHTPGTWCTFKAPLDPQASAAMGLHELTHPQEREYDGHFSKTGPPKRQSLTMAATTPPPYPSDILYSSSSLPTLPHLWKATTCQALHQALVQSLNLPHQTHIPLEISGPAALGLPLLYQPHSISPWHFAWTNNLTPKDFYKGPKYHMVPHCL